VNSTREGYKKCWPTYAVDFCVLAIRLLVDAVYPVGILGDEVVGGLSFVDDAQHVLSDLVITGPHEEPPVVETGLHDKFCGDGDDVFSDGVCQALSVHIRTHPRTQPRMWKQPGWQQPWASTTSGAPAAGLKGPLLNRAMRSATASERFYLHMLLG